MRKIRLVGEGEITEKLRKALKENDYKITTAEANVIVVIKDEADSEEIASLRKYSNNNAYRVLIIGKDIEYIYTTDYRQQLYTQSYSYKEFDIDFFIEEIAKETTEAHMQKRVYFNRNKSNSIICIDSLFFDSEITFTHPQDADIFICLDFTGEYLDISGLDIAAIELSNFKHIVVATPGRVFTEGMKAQLEDVFEVRKLHIVDSNNLEELHRTLKHNTWT